MKKNLNLSLYKSLINTDFLFTEKLYHNNVNLSIKTFLNKKETLNFLDPIKTLKDLKQFIRLLQFLKYAFKFKKNIKRILLILADNPQYTLIIEKILNKSKLPLDLTIINKNILNFQKNKSLKILLKLDDQGTNLKNSNTFFNSNYFLINRINSNLNSLNDKDKYKEKTKKRFNTFLVFQSGNVILSSPHKECMKDVFYSFLQIIKDCETKIKELNY